MNWLYRRLINSGAQNEGLHQGSVGSEGVSLLPDDTTMEDIMQKFLAIIGGVVVGCIGLMIVGALLGGGQGASQVSVSSGGGNTEAPQSAAVGDMVTIGDTQWQVGSASLEEAISSNSFSATPAAGRFLVVVATVTNNGKEAQSLFNPKVKDSEGRTFEVTTDMRAIMANEQSCALERLNPGTAKTCAFIYDVPASAGGFAFIAAELGIFGDETLITLGP